MREYSNICNQTTLIFSSNIKPEPLTNISYIYVDCCQRESLAPTAIHFGFICESFEIYNWNQLPKWTINVFCCVEFYDVINIMISTCVRLSVHLCCCVYIIVLFAQRMQIRGHNNPFAHLHFRTWVVTSHIDAFLTFRSLYLTPVCGVTQL